MNRFRLIATGALYLSTIIALPTDAVADPDDPYRPGLFSVRGGVSSTTEFKVTPKDGRPRSSWSTEPSYTLGVSFESFLSSKASIAVTIDVTDIKFGADLSENMLELGAIVKANIQKAHTRVAVRPGVGVGFGLVPKMTLSKSLADLQGQRYVTAGFITDFVFCSRYGPGFLAEFGVHRIIRGGDDNHTVKSDPMFTARIGFVL